MYNIQVAHLKATYTDMQSLFATLKDKVVKKVIVMREDRTKHWRIDYGTGVDSSGSGSGYGTSVSYHKSDGRVVDKECPQRKGLKAEDHPRTYIGVQNEKTFWGEKYNNSEMVQKTEEFSKGWAEGLNAHVQRYPKLLLEAMELHQKAVVAIKASFDPRVPQVPPLLEVRFFSSRSRAMGL